jgi:hypothetical protein
MEVNTNEDKFYSMASNGEYRKGFSGIIKHRETEKYYTGGGQWTSEAEKAKQFTSLHDLADETRKYNIKDCCEFILKLVGQPGFCVFLPL